MDDSIKWMAGVIMALVTMIGGIMTRDRQLLAKIEDGDIRAMNKIDALQRDYVRRDELKDHLLSIEKMIALSRDEQKEMRNRVDHLITSINNQKRGD